MNLVFQNISHGMHFAGETPDNRDIFYKYWPSAYIEYYHSHKIDIFCLAEVPLDDKYGSSNFITKFAKELHVPNYKIYVNEKSWIVEDKYYGMAILSKYPITSYKSFNLPNPKLEVDHPDGTHWVTHNKGAQKAIIEINGKRINIFNLHYFPFHHFGRRINEDEFRPIRTKLADILKPKTEDERIIVAGDFNNKGLEIEEALPEIFEKNVLKRTISFKRSDYEAYSKEGETQIDHILYSPKNLKYINGNVESNYSDHSGLKVEFELM